MKRSDRYGALKRRNSNPHADKFELVKTGKTRPAPSIEEIDTELSYLKAHLGEEAVNSFTGEYVYMRLNAPNTKLELKEEFVEMVSTNDTAVEELGECVEECNPIDDIACRFENLKLAISCSDKTPLDDAVKVIDQLIYATSL